MIGPMSFSPVKATWKFLIERIESLFVDSVMIELDLNDNKSELTTHIAFFLTAVSQLRAVTILWHNYA